MTADSSNVRSSHQSADAMQAQDSGHQAAGREARFWDRIAERYARKPVPDEAVYRRKLAITQRYLRPDMALLEFGCGTGTTAIEHAPHVNSILATDISGAMLDIARLRAADAGVDNVHFRQQTLAQLTLANGSLDAVLGLSILHLLDDRGAALAKVHRLLKPGGLFISSTPCLADSLWFLKPLLAVGSRLGLVPQVQFFSRDNFQRELAGAGFDIEYQWQPGSRQGVFIVARKAR